MIAAARRHRFTLATALVLLLAPWTAVRAQVLLTQPNITSIAPIMFNPKSIRTPFPSGVFGLVIWQPNPYRPDGKMVPISSWDAGVKTGLHVSNLGEGQSGYIDQAGTTVGQASGGAVGAYLNSTDFTSHGKCDKMMITPQYRYRPSDMKYPFASMTGTIDVSFDLQVPTAIGGNSPTNNVYVTADVQYLDPVRNVKISNGIRLFHLNSSANGPQSVGHDQNSGSYMLNVPLAPGSSWVTPLPGSATFTGTPWTGYRTFSFQVSSANLKAGLDALNAKYPSLNPSLNPRDYGLSQFHINAELHCSGGHAELGWSMRKLMVTLAKAP